MNYLTYYDIIEPLDIEKDWTKELKSSNLYESCLPIIKKYGEEGNRIIKLLTLCYSPQHKVAKMTSNRFNMKVEQANKLGLDTGKSHIINIINNKCDISKKFVSGLFLNMKNGEIYRTYLAILDFYSERDKIISEGFSTDMKDIDNPKSGLDVRLKELEIRDKSVVSAIKNQYGFDNFIDFQKFVIITHSIKLDEDEISPENKDFNISDTIDKIKK